MRLDYGVYKKEGQKGPPNYDQSFWEDSLGKGDPLEMEALPQ